MPCRGKGGSRRGVLPLCLLSVLLLWGCAAPAEGIKLRECRVVFEDNAEARYTFQVYTVAAGEDLTVTLGIPEGLRLAAVSYSPWSLSGSLGTSGGYVRYALTLHRVRYSTVVSLDIRPDRELVYHLGEGLGTLTVKDDSPRLRLNTLPYRAEFSRPGYLPIGWNTAPEGAGTAVGFGSRTERSGGERQDFYAQWLACTPEDAFTWEPDEEGVRVTGCSAAGDLVLPDTLGGLPVRCLAAGAFGNVTAETVAFPPSLERVEAGAFRSLTAEKLYLFDGLTEVEDASFGELSVVALHINALRPPAYCGSYFDTLTEKLDYLRSLAGEKKLLLFCGSSARFGYDSPAIEAAFPNYRVVNLGVYAYANMLPQAELALHFAEAGDVLLSSPELDAIEAQFCGETALDRETFCMLESDYDLLSLLDCRAFTGAFSAFAAYQRERARLPARSYTDVPSQYDEDGLRRDTPTYNRAGDYILHRESNFERRSFGVKRAFYNAEHIRPGDWEGLNRVYDAFAAKGVTVLFTWSPRSAGSVSPDSSPERIAALDALARERLHARVISDIWDSLMDPIYFYGTDNHLSSEGAALHTAKVIEDLREAYQHECPPLLRSRMEEDTRREAEGP